MISKADCIKCKEKIKLANVCKRKIHKIIAQHFIYACNSKT